MPVDELVEFCNHVNSGTALQGGVHSLFALRRGDDKRAASGLPGVPERYRPFLLQNPINAKIASIDGTRITIDVGSRDGAFVGMEMFVTDRKYTVRSIKLTKIDEQSAIAEERSCFVPDQPKLLEGVPLSTRAPWAR